MWLKDCALEVINSDLLDDILVKSGGRVIKYRGEGATKHEGAASQVLHIQTMLGGYKVSAMLGGWGATSFKTVLRPGLEPLLLGAQTVSTL